MNTIPQNQNTEQHLEHLAAYRQLYTDARWIQALRIMLAAPLVVAWSIMIAIWPSLTVYAALWGIGVILVDSMFLLPYQRSKQQQAAKVQELYDCELLRLPWREMKTGRRPDIETIAESAAKYRKRKKDPNYAKFINWYPISIGKLPLHLARIICQRTNNWWDAKLRRSYAAGVCALLIALIVVVTLIAVLQGFSIQKLILAVLNPLLPAFNLGINEFKEYRRSANVADHLKECSEDLWNKAISGGYTAQELEAETRNLQDEIYDRRRGNPLVFQWIYNLNRESNEQQANKAAEAMVEEALHKGQDQTGS